ncbi:hypothetical protein ACF0H5_004411 [Mactra antiquata]
MIQVAEKPLFRILNTDEVPRMHTLESENFPSDEADSYNMLAYRQRQAPNLQLGCYINGIMIGFIGATRYNGETYNKEAMKTHIPNGGSVCIHSVVVQKEHRRKGIGLKLLQAFVKQVKEEQNNVTKILLISKPEHIPLYERAGFVLKGKSDIDLGKDTWYEFEIPLQSKY